MGYRGTVGAEMAGFDILVSLSRYEGLPINVIEAGWAGTPVLATAIDGNLYLMPSPDFGMLFSVHAVIAKVAAGLGSWLDDATKRRTVGLALQNRVENQFSRAVRLQHLRELYGH
jgi:glycosyltransferase involved in cell wall biosynthesis